MGSSTVPRPVWFRLQVPRPTTFEVPTATLRTSTSGWSQVALPSFRVVPSSTSMAKAACKFNRTTLSRLGQLATFQCQFRAKGVSVVRPRISRSVDGKLLEIVLRALGLTIRSATAPVTAGSTLQTSLPRWSTWCAATVALPSSTRGLHRCTRVVRFRVASPRQPWTLMAVRSSWQRTPP